MKFFKEALVLATAVCAALARPQSGPQSQYLPPDDQGYNYDRPSVPFPPRPQPTFPTRPNFPQPSGQPSNYNPQQQQQQQQGDHHHDHVHEPGMPYDFNYAVKDDYFGTDYSRNEVSDGDVVTGEYRVQLPDGRLQIVRYTADWKTGFHADVSYEGEAQYPQGPTGYNYPAAGAQSPQYGVPATDGGSSGGY